MPWLVKMLFVLAKTRRGRKLLFGVGLTAVELARHERARKLYAQARTAVTDPALRATLKRNAQRAVQATRPWVHWTMAVMVLLLVSACGSSGRLSASQYRAHLTTIGKESNSAQHAVARGFQAKSVPALTKTLTAFAAAQKRIGDQVSALKPPKDAATANTELANGLRDTGSEVQAVLPKVEKMSSAEAAIAYLSKTPTTKGGHEIDQALAQLKKLGYINATS